MFGGFPFGGGWFGGSPSEAGAAPPQDITGTGEATAAAGQSAGVGSVPVQTSGGGSGGRVEPFRRRRRRMRIIEELPTGETVVWPSKPVAVTGTGNSQAAAAASRGVGHVISPVRASGQAVGLGSRGRAAGGVVLPTRGRGAGVARRARSDAPYHRTPHGVPTCAGAVDAGVTEEEMLAVLMFVE